MLFVKFVEVGGIGKLNPLFRIGRLDKKKWPTVRGGEKFTTIVCLRKIRRWNQHPY